MTYDTPELTECKRCSILTDVLAIFAGGLCLACYEVLQDEVPALWRFAHGH